MPAALSAARPSSQRPLGPAARWPHTGDPCDRAQVNNALQSSCTLQPEKYPRNSPDLKMAQEVGPAPAHRLLHACIKASGGAAWHLVRTAHRSNSQVALPACAHIAVHILARHSSATLVQRHAVAWPGAWQVLNVLIAVNDLASGRMEYSLEVNLVLVSDA